jgi:hypothetical protein
MSRWIRVSGDSLQLLSLPSAGGRSPMPILGTSQDIKMPPLPKVVSYELQTKKRVTHEETTMELPHDRIFS